METEDKAPANWGELLEKIRDRDFGEDADAKDSQLATPAIKTIKKSWEAWHDDQLAPPEVPDEVQQLYQLKKRNGNLLPEGWIVVHAPRMGQLNKLFIAFHQNLHEVVKANGKPHLIVGFKTPNSSRAFVMHESARDIRKQMARKFLEMSDDNDGMVMANDPIASWLIASWPQGVPKPPGLVDNLLNDLKEIRTAMSEGRDPFE